MDEKKLIGEALLVLRIKEWDRLEKLNKLFVKGEAERQAIEMHRQKITDIDSVVKHYIEW